MKPKLKKINNGSKMKKYYFVVMLSVVLSLCSCEQHEPASVASKSMQIGLNDIFTIDSDRGHLLTVNINNPEISVSSMFSNVTVMPKIALVGQFNSAFEIPLTIPAVLFTAADIVDNGGYLITISTYDATKKADRQWKVRLFIKHIKDSGGNLSGLYVEYAVY